MKRNVVAFLILVVIPYSAATANCLWENRWYQVGFVLPLPDGSHIQCQANGTWIQVR
jgi:hypothetical protein